MDNVILIGGGGHAKVIIDALQSMGCYSISGIIEKDERAVGGDVFGIPIIGTDRDIVDVLAQGITNAFIAIGSVKSGDNIIRANLFCQTRATGFNMINVIHNSAQISRYITIGEGNAILAYSVVNAGAQIGSDVIVNTGAIVEHDCTIADHVHIATGTRICGGVSIGQYSHVGAGATIIQGIRIGSDVTIGAGAVVIDDIPDGATAVGVPAKIQPVKEE